MNDIQQKAMLVKISIGLPGLRRKDKETSAEIKRDKNLGEDSGQWQKQLYPDTAVKKPKGLTKDAAPTNAWVWQSQFRAGVKELTLAWPDEGFRLLPMTKHHEFTAYARTQTPVFEAMIDKFVANLADYEKWARVEHNGTFDPKFYGEDWVRCQFRFRVELRPIPGDDQFSNGISAMVGATNVDECVREALAEANKDLFGRLIAPVQKMVEALKQKGKTFRDSLITNVGDVIANVESLNVTGDPALSDLCKQMRDKLAVQDPERLRKRPLVRDQAVKDAEDILDRMKGYVM